MGNEYLLKGNVVNIPYFGCNASSTSISSLRFVGVGRFCVQTDSLCLRVNLILNSLSIPLSSLCLAKIL